MSNLNCIADNNNYSPFGTVLYGRKWSAESYRYGFNGMESLVTQGLIEFYSTEFRLFNSSLARWYTIDPILKCWEGPYNFSYNSPIRFNDPRGTDPVGDQTKIKEGDTLWGISKESNGKFTVDDLIKWNPGIDPVKLKIGQVINISDPSKGMKLGTTGKVGEGEDSTCGGGDCGPVEMPTNSEGIDQIREFEASTTNPEFTARNTYLFVSEGATTVSWCFHDVGVDVDKAEDRFLLKNGGTFTDFSNALNEYYRSTSWTAIRTAVTQQFQSAMSVSQGDLTHVVENIGTLPNPPNMGPICKSMLALFGGTQQLDVILMDYTLVGDRSYKAEIQIQIWDDYGVSTEDFTKYKNGSAKNSGVKSFWYLQHRCGYKPLKTGITLKLTVEGKY